MKNRITVTIAGSEYTLVAEEDEAYIRKVASYADSKISEVMEGAHASLADSAVLGAVNLADEYYKLLETCENLRKQVKDFAEEDAKTKLDLSKAKQEIFRLQTKK